MASDLPPGVRGPIPNPSEVEKNRDDNVTETFPTVTTRSTLNPAPYLATFFAYTLHLPSIKLKQFVEGLRSPTKRRYYHEKFNRVPEIWECKTDDYVCVYEAEVQFKRDKMVDTAILEILEKDMNHCQRTYPVSWEETCKDKIEEFWEMKRNWHTKYADMGVFQNARNALNKQKNRFVEKRYKERVGMEYKDDWIFQDFAEK